MDTTDTWPPPDPLGEALHLLRMSGAFYCRSELSEPWGMTLHSMPGYLWFRVVTTGRVPVEIDEEQYRWLHPGDLALVPHGNGHRLRSDPGADAPQIMNLRRAPPSPPVSPSSSASPRRSTSRAGACTWR